MRPVRIRPRWLSMPRPLLFALGLVGAGACTTFDDQSTVLDLRVLAMQTEPSEIIIDDPAAPIPSISVRPLLADHDGDVSDATFQIIGCPNQAFGAAPPSDPMASGGFPAGGPRGTLSSTLCPVDPASPHRWVLASSDQLRDDKSVAVNLSADQLQDALMSDVFRDQFGNTHDGFDLGLPINLELDVTRGSTTIKAVKRVLFWFPPLVPAIVGEVPNQTPVIDKVSWATDRDDDAVLQGLAPWDMTDQPMVAPGGELWVVPSLATQEPYQTTVLDATTGAVQPYAVAAETLRYFFFATRGKFSPSETSTDPGRGVHWNDGKPHLEAKYEAPPLANLPLDPATSVHVADVTVWIVVRDDRGGVSWQKRRLRVSE